MSIIDTAWRSGGLAEWETSKREGHDGLGGSELMSSSLPKGQTARAYTPPKGRPTPARRDRAVARSARVRSRHRLEWAAVIIVGVVLLGLLFALGASGWGQPQVPVTIHGG